MGNLFRDACPLFLLFPAELVEILTERGKVEEAIVVGEQRCEVLGDLFGHSHRRSLEAMRDLASLLRSEWPEEAVAVLQERLDLMSASLGDSHPGTREAREELLSLQDALHK